jgi:hypothetical protein
VDSDAIDPAILAASRRRRRFPSGALRRLPTPSARLIALWRHELAAGWAPRTLDAATFVRLGRRADALRVTLSDEATALITFQRSAVTRSKAMLSRWSCRKASRWIAMS